MPAHDFTVSYDGHQYDVTKFLNYHPGGEKALSSFRDKDVTNIMQVKSRHKHSKAAYYLLKHYEDNLEKKQSKDNDDDLEDLVDWSKPMSTQVGNLGSMYERWINAPVDRPMRIFKYDFLEALSRTPWFVVPSAYIPIVLYLLVTGYTNQQSSLGTMIAFFIVGMSQWTCLEYSIHRWIFHMHPPSKSFTLITLHFFLHGIHHKVPYDEYRLVLPLGLSLPLAYLAHTINRAIFPLYSYCHVSAGLILGYTIYDVMHYYLHYGAPNMNSYFGRRKHIHSYHHFVHPNKGFAVSNSLLDLSFSTYMTEDIE